MMKHTIALFFAFACVKVHGQVVDSTTVISNAPCVNISANAAQNDVVVRLVLPPLEALNAETATIQLTNSTGNILPYFKGQAWADSSEVWVRFDSLPVEESIFFVSTFGYSHPNDPHQVFDLYDSFDSSSLDEDIWSVSVQSGASFNVGNGELSMNVTQTDNYCSIYSNQSFDLDQNWAIHLQARTQDNRGHVCMAIGSGYDSERLANGGYNQLNGYGIGEGHDADWTAHLKVDGNGFQPEYVGEDLSYAPMIASWAENEYRLCISGSLASTLEVGVGEKPSGEHPFFIWLNAWDGNNRSLWLDFVALYVAAEAIIQVDESGCLEPQACNYNPAACTSDESCDYTCCPGPGCCHAGTTWDMDLQKCVVANPADTNLDGCVQLNDLLDVLSAYGDCGAGEAPWACGDPLSYQGYDYATVQIGDQCWFAENLRYLPSVSHVTTGSETDSSPHAYVYGYNGTNVQEAQSHSTYTSFGALYNFEAVSEWEMCPNGWHVPSDEEFGVLEASMGMPSADISMLGWRASDTALGNALRSNEHWVLDDGVESGIAGFQGHPSGYRISWLGDEYFENAEVYGAWWTSTADSNPQKAFQRGIASYNLGILRTAEFKQVGFAVRCIKNAE